MILLDPSARPIIAHRGASGSYPENTILAFERGLASGADALEFDVRLAADSVPVVIHDPTVDRTTDGVGAVADFTAKELGRLDAGAGEAVPTLDAVLETFPRVPLIVEVKEARAALPLARALERHGACEMALVGSFLQSALTPLDSFAINRSASRRETAALWVLSRLHVAPIRPRYVALTVPIRHGRLRVVDRRFVSASARRMMPIHVWTVDDPEEAVRLRAMGVSGIITNCPDRLVGHGRG